MNRNNICVCWNRDNQPPVVNANGSPRANIPIECLWSAGFISNRKIIEAQEHLPHTFDDQELLLHLYRKYNWQAAKHIAGPFAWMLWDATTQTLIATRDRVGTHGLYYSYRDKNIQIANRVDYLLGLLSSSPRFNLRSVIGHIDQEAPLVGETFYEDINELPPANVLIVRHDHVQVYECWHLQPQSELKLSSDFEYASAFRKLLYDITAEYSESGRLGATLSSGMDSSSVVAAIRASQPHANLPAFVWASPEIPEANESELALITAERLHISNIQIPVDQYWTLHEKDGLTTERSTPYYQVFTEAWAETFRSMKECRIERAFTGIGGDHLFGSNVYVYPDLLLTGRWLELIRQLRRDIIFSQARSKKRLIGNLVFSPIKQACFPQFSRNTYPRVNWLDKRYHELFRQAFRPQEKSMRMLPSKKKRYDILTHRIVPFVISHLNFQASDYGIELVHPLMDHRLFEFALSIPTTQTYRNGVEKIIMRNAMRGALPDEIVNLSHKILPWGITDRGLRERESAKVWHLVTNMRAAELGLVDEKNLQATYRAYLAGKHNDTSFWNTLTLEDWLRRYF